MGKEHTMKKSLWIVILILVFFGIESRAQVTAIKAGKLVLPDTGEALTNQVILVEDSKIKAVGGDVQRFRQVQRSSI